MNQGPDQAGAQDPVFANAQLLQLFPSCVWLHDVKPEVYEPLNQRLLPIIDTLIDQQPLSERGETWQTHHDLHQRDDFSDFVALARKAARGALEHLQVDYGDFQITGCWANVNPPQSTHRPHCHPNNFLSGVYYAQVPKKGDGLVFHEPRPQALVLSPKVKKLSVFTGSEANLDVQEGRLIVFPSWLQHSVVKTRASGNRVSISFNIMLSSYAEDYSPPRWSKAR